MRLMKSSTITDGARLSRSCRKLPGMRKPAKPGAGSAAESSGAAADTASNTGASSAGSVRRAAAPARIGAASAGGRGGRIPAAPRRGGPASAKPLRGAAHEKMPDQAAGGGAFGPLAAGRLHASSTAQVIRLSPAGVDAQPIRISHSQHRFSDATLKPFHLMDHGLKELWEEQGRPGNQCSAGCLLEVSLLLLAPCVHDGSVLGCRR